MLVLGIESSCDETAAAVVVDGKRALSNVVSSQVDVHCRFGGVVPELASRKHLEAISPIVQQALLEAKLQLHEIHAIAVTQGPGLMGSLLVGLSFAKALSYAQGLPFIGISHIEGHLASVHLEEDTPSFPYLSLMVSGGHTALYHVSDYTDYVLLGKTRDDAAGEAFDKVAKMLGLGYPGGEIIGRLADEGDAESIDFPRAFMGKDSLDFSFSGIKTAVAHYIRSREASGLPLPLADISASFQAAVVDVLVEKTVRAARQYNVKDIVAVGGVSANRRLRTSLRDAARTAGLNVFVPGQSLCTDNAAMIAVAGYHRLRKGQVSDLDLDAYSRSKP